MRLQTSRIGQEHRPIRCQLPARLSFRQGQRVDGVFVNDMLPSCWSDSNTRCRCSGHRCECQNQGTSPGGGGGGGGCGGSCARRLTAATTAGSGCLIGGMIWLDGQPPPN